MRDRNSKIDVTHPLAPDDAARDFDTGLLTDDTVVTNPLVLPAETLEVLRGTEDALTEESVWFRTLCSIVDGFWLRDFSSRPTEDVFWASDAQCDGIE